MSFNATQWAWNVSVNTSSQRLVLLALADRAGVEHTAWPSIERIARDTLLDKKTVQKVIVELMNFGLIRDTGKRKGMTKKVRVLQLSIVKKSDKTLIKSNNSSFRNAYQDIGENKPKNGLLNESKIGLLNDPKIGMQNLSLNLSMNLSREHDWVPERDQLICVLNSAGHQQNLRLILELPDFDFQLGAFNAYFNGRAMSDEKKLYSFGAWIIDKFERYKKANPEYLSQATHDSVKQVKIPVFNLEDRKPKSLLGNIQ
ncbi:helix-turn-helix domain-containing protein [Acinetobacter schindleri]|uniref:helix-turn-helix domain-containing protein n=1 Tax=Acinetobacter schindleri TaxID=108981 RepID=UPI003CFEE293